MYLNKFNFSRAIGLTTVHSSNFYFIFIFTYQLLVGISRFIDIILYSYSKFTVFH